MQERPSRPSPDSLHPDGSLKLGEGRLRTGPKARIDLGSSEAHKARHVTQSQDSAGGHQSGGDTSDVMSSDTEMNLYEHDQDAILPEPTASALQQHLRNQAPRASSTQTTQDTEMDDLTRSLAGTSLDFLPRGVRKKQKDKEKAAQAFMGM